MRQQIKEMDHELEQYHKSNAALDLMIGELRLRMEGMEQAKQQQMAELAGCAGLTRRFQYDLHQAVQNIEDYKLLKAAVVELYKKYVTEAHLNGGQGNVHVDAAAAASTEGDEGKDPAAGGRELDAMRDHQRQREYLVGALDAALQQEDGGAVPRL